MKINSTFAETAAQVSEYQNFSPVGWTILLIVACWSFAFSLACREASFESQSERSFVFMNMMRGARSAFGNQFVLEADRWFHRGVGHFHEAGFESWFTRMADVVTPREHLHLRDESVEEIMPWLFFATRADPSNIDAYSIAAFFLSGQMERFDLAEHVLREAQLRNPGDYRVFYERGRLALKMGKLEDSARLFNAAIRLWPGERDLKDADLRNDRAAMLLYRGLLYEMEGCVDEAIKLYNEVLEMFPSRQGLSQRVQELETAGRAEASPEDIWNMMLFHHPLVCAHEEHSH